MKRQMKSVRQERQAIAQRCANERAKAQGLPLPYPNPWDIWDPTKVRPDATPEEIHWSYLEFRKLCAPPLRKSYTI